ncbi:hypothetical protein ACEN9X_13460 [Mucilaginibacter sp. Mucisp86]|uniref:hypothetical protein n=1 Tax=Mucilaginibacter sp. Mucisp86 TaxID=3243060 RepID=UPI0039B6A664
MKKVLVPSILLLSLKGGFSGLRLINNNKILPFDKVMGVPCGRAIRSYCTGIRRGPVSATIPNAGICGLL